MRFWRFASRDTQRRPGELRPLATGVDAKAGDGARRDLLGRVGSFLLGNQLDVSARNLVISHAAFSGGHLELGRRIAVREFERQAITQDWLEEAIVGDPEFADRQEEFDAISTGRWRAFPKPRGRHPRPRRATGSNCRSTPTGSKVALPTACARSICFT